MKTISLLVWACTFLLGISVIKAQESKPSPAATATETLNNGTTVTIAYSQPALKGRTMGKDVEPMDGKVWRAGANEATVFEVNKNVTVNGTPLAAGKYGFFVLVNDGSWTLIFNKTWKQWGAFKYNEAEDALRVKVKPGKTATPMERLTYLVDKSGKVSLTWGDVQASFTIQ